MVRASANGFYCSDCGLFTHKGFDHRDHKAIKKGDAFCGTCFQAGFGKCKKAKIKEKI